MTHKYYIDNNDTYIEIMYDGEVPEDFTPVPRREAEWYDLVDGAWVRNQSRYDIAIAEEVRSIRARYLYTLDKVVSNPLRWSELGAEKQVEWTRYRLALLDVPQQSGFPHNVTWPTKP